MPERVSGEGAESAAQAPTRTIEPTGPASLVSATEVVASADWTAHCLMRRDGGARFFDFLTAIDRVSAGELEVVAHLADLARRRRWLVSTRIDREAPRLDSLAAVYLGADWHEREAAEMFGIEFVGHPDLRPLLTTGDVGHPLLRTSALPARLGTAWPGAFDPATEPVRAAEADGTAPTAGLASPPQRVAARPRNPVRPPGIPQEWGQ